MYLFGGSRQLRAAPGSSVLVGPWPSIVCRWPVVAVHPGRRRAGRCASRPGASACSTRCEGRCEGLLERDTQIAASTEDSRAGAASMASNGEMVKPMEWSELASVARWMAAGVECCPAVETEIAFASPPWPTRNGEAHGVAAAVSW